MCVSVCVCVCVCVRDHKTFSVHFLRLSATLSYVYFSFNIATICMFGGPGTASVRIKILFSASPPDSVRGAYILLYSMAGVHFPVL